VLSGVETIRARATQNLTSSNLDLVGRNVRYIAVNGRRAIGAAKGRADHHSGEKLLLLLDQSARTSTHKPALLLALIDRVQEYLDQEQVPVRVLAERVIELYWPQTLAYPTTAVVPSQSQAGGQAMIVSSILQFRDQHATASRALPETVRRGEAGRGSSIASKRRSPNGRSRACCTRVAAKREIDHFIPWGHSGDDGLDNLVAACRRCNNAKRAALPGPDHVADLTERNRTWNNDLRAIAEERRWPRDLYAPDGSHERPTCARRKVWPATSSREGRGSPRPQPGRTRRLGCAAHQRWPHTSR
jgi:HNH endonuclease